MKISSSIITILAMPLTPFAKAYLRTSPDGEVGEAMASIPLDGEPEPEDLEHPMIAEPMDDEDQDNHGRHLYSGNCGVFSDGKYGHLDAGTCANLGGTWWNDRITWTRGSDNNCIKAYEHHSGGQSTETCGSDWKQLGGLSREVSRVCCSASGGSSGGSGSSCGSSSKTGDVFASTNAYRSRNGRHALSCHAGMSRVIQNYLQTLCNNNSGLTHNFGGTTPGGRLTSAGIRWTYNSENIAYGTHTD